MRGLTLTSVASASANPPLFVFSVATESRRLASLRAAPVFSVAFPAADQADVAARFAEPERGGPPIPDGIVFHDSGVPMMSGSRAGAIAHLVDSMQVGSSMLFVAEADEIYTGRDAPPLLYVGRQFATLSPALGAERE
ncbi:flavin reductase family protein [Promicromonospora sp. NPDC057488]|uniref:flavin reductase family protein n=1 Tax=Promicromonospora sp. NPDC057488 TaxID=3346147 RepID=UPI00366DF352